jgi:hypothetical protein
MGNKNSGRRPMSVEMRRHRAIDKAWELTVERLESEDPKRFDTAEAIATRDMTVKQDVNSKVMLTLTPEEQSILDKYVQCNRLAN